MPPIDTTTWLTGRWQCCASMWTVEESDAMREAARGIVPGIKTYAIPHGLQVKDGPDAIVEHLKVQIPALLEA